jgi:hypothetical protein
MGAMKEAVERLRAAWYVLRGWSVVRGVSFTYGEVDVHRHGLMLSGKSKIERAQIWTQGPVTFRGKGEHSGNEGDALTRTG